MKEYPKIETILDRDEQTFKVIEGKWRLPEFAYLQTNQWMFTEKVDGTNVRVMWDGKTIKFGGRTDDAQMPTFLLAKLQELFPATKFGEFTDPVCLYGEGYGARIQKGGGNYNPKGVDFILFDVRIGEWWLKWEDVQDVARRLEIRHVPVIRKGTLLEAVALVRRGLQSQWGNFLAEGVVLRPTVDLATRHGDRLIGKLKGKDFGATP